MITRRIANVLHWTALGAFALMALAFFEHASRRMFYRFSLDYTELPELGRAAALAAGETIYADPAGPPWLVANYTPLYTALNAIAVAVFGPQLWSGRLISLLCTVGTGLLLARVARRLGARHSVAALAPLMLWSSHVVWLYGTLVRVDPLAMLLSVGALVVAHEGWLQERRPRALTTAALLLVAAAFTRQTMVAGAFALLSWLAFHDRRALARPLAVWAGVGLAAGLALLAATDCHAWWHLVTANVNEYRWPNTLWFYRELFSLYGWLLLLALGGIVTTRKSLQARLWLLYLLGAAAVSLTIGKVGASLNYLLELHAALCLFATLLLSRLEQRPVWARLGALVVVLAGCLHTLHTPWERTSAGSARAPTHWQPLAEWANRQAFVSMPSLEDARAHARLAETLADVPGDIIVEDMDFTLTRGRPILLQPFEITQLARQGVVDSAPIVSAFAEERFSLVLLQFDLHGDPTQIHDDRFSPLMRTALREHYRLVGQQAGYWIYAARAAHIPQPNEERPRPAPAR